jgi:hypothetical protein
MQVVVWMQHILKLALGQVKWYLIFVTYVLTYEKSQVLVARNYPHPQLYALFTFIILFFHTALDEFTSVFGTMITIQLKIRSKNKIDVYQVGLKLNTLYTSRILHNVVSNRKCVYRAEHKIKLCNIQLCMYILYKK